MVSSVVLAISTGLPLASSSMFTVPEGTPPELVTATVSVVKVVVSPDVGQDCGLDCAVNEVDVVYPEPACAAGSSAKAIPNPAIHCSRRPRQFFTNHVRLLQLFQKDSVSPCGVSPVFLLVNPYCIWPGRTAANPAAPDFWAAGLTFKRRIGECTRPS